MKDDILSAGLTALSCDCNKRTDSNKEIFSRVMGLLLLYSFGIFHYIIVVPQTVRQGVGGMPPNFYGPSDAPRQRRILIFLFGGADISAGVKDGGTA